MAAGLFRILQGLTKKALLADTLGRYADLVFDAPSAYSGPEALLGVYAYALQIYLDFSGYSDIALGLARVLGVRIPENFRSPYRATSASPTSGGGGNASGMSMLAAVEYLYVSLGGNWHGRPRQVASLMITMLLGGLWHGASWTFVVWGGLHGNAAGRGQGGARALRRAALAGRPGPGLDRHLATGLRACGVVFRARTLAGAGAVLSALTRGWDPARAAALVSARRDLCAVVLVGFLLSVTPGRLWERVEARFRVLPTFAKACAFVLVVAGGAASLDGRGAAVHLLPVLTQGDRRSRLSTARSGRSAFSWRSARHAPLPRSRERHTSGRTS